MEFADKQFCNVRLVDCVGYLVPGAIGHMENDAPNDHRIAMSLAIAAQKCAEPISLSGAESVAKSYPTFWEDYKSVGGLVEEEA